jgi:hypothetical protein
MTQDFSLPSWPIQPEMSQKVPMMCSFEMGFDFQSASHLGEIFLIKRGSYPQTTYFSLGNSDHFCIEFTSGQTWMIVRNSLEKMNDLGATSMDMSLLKLETRPASQMLFLAM